MSEWQPFESAPKDGTQILVCHEQLKYWGRPILIVRWFRGKWCSQDFHNFFPDEEFKCWMPLPEMPKNE